MSAKRFLGVIGGVAVLLFFGAFVGAVPQAHADATCDSTQEMSLNSATNRATSGNTLCFRAYVEASTAYFGLTLTAQSGAFDLYLAPGYGTTQLNGIEHKLNSYPISAGDAPSEFVFQQPDAGYYVIAVEPAMPGGGAFQLQSESSGSSSASASGFASECSGDICTGSYPLTAAAANDVHIGPAYGSQAVFPITVVCPGKITVSARWAGSADNLALILNGPGQVGYYARRDGRSPLSIEYTVSAAEVARGKRWTARLINFGGGAASAALDIIYPDANDCPLTVALPTITKVVDFATWSSGAKVTGTRLLAGDEFTARGIKVSAAPSGAYCADARAAVRVDSYASAPYLSTARPTQMSACSGVPVRVDLTEPARSVSVAFVGAADQYTLTAYNAAGKQIGQAAQRGQLGKVVTVTYKSAAPDIMRIVFGRQAAITVVTALTLEVLRPLPLAPALIAPSANAVFSHYPRTTRLEWATVPGAVHYTVEVDCLHCCQSGKWCTDVGKTWKVVSNVKGTSYTFDFVGAQPGRWRVWAADAAGREGPKSSWREFRYTR